MSQRLRRTLLATPVLVMGALLGVTACSSLLPPKTLHVDQSAIQAATNRKWESIAKTLKENGIIASNPVIVLMPNQQRVGAKFSAKIASEMLGMTFLSGDIQMSGVPVYSPEQQAVVLKEFAVDSFDVNNMPAFVDGAARRVAQTWVGKKIGFDIPIYKLTNEQLTAWGEKWTLQKIQIEPNNLSITLQPQNK